MTFPLGIAALSIWKTACLFYKTLIWKMLAQGWPQGNFVSNWRVQKSDIFCNSRKVCPHVDQRTTPKSWDKPKFYVYDIPSLAHKNAAPFSCTLQSSKQTVAALHTWNQWLSRVFPHKSFQTNLVESILPHTKHRVENCEFSFMANSIRIFDFILKSRKKIWDQHVNTKGNILRRYKSPDYSIISP